MNNLILIFQVLSRIIQLWTQWRALEEKKKSMAQLKQAMDKAVSTGSTKEINEWLNGRL